MRLLHVYVSIPNDDVSHARVRDPQSKSFLHGVPKFWLGTPDFSS